MVTRNSLILPLTVNFLRKAVKQTIEIFTCTDEFTDFCLWTNITSL